MTTQNSPTLGQHKLSILASCIATIMLSACGGTPNEASANKDMARLGLNNGDTASLKAIPAGPPPASQLVATFDSNLLKSRYSQTCTANQKPDFISALPMVFGKIYPEDCAIANNTSPVLQWPAGNIYPAATDTTPWNIQINKDGKSYLTATSKFPHFQIPAELPAGEYQWTVNYKASNGNIIASSPRRFFVDASAVSLPIITPKNIVDAAKIASRPRGLPHNVSREQMLGNITSNATAPFAVLSAKIKTIQAQKVITQPPMMQPSDFPVATDYTRWVNSLNTTATTAASEIAYLGYMAALTNDATTKAAGKARLLEMAKWDADTGTTSFQFQDQAARQVLLGLAKGYDYFYADLSAQERDQVIAVIKNRTRQMATLITSIHTKKLNSHGVTDVGFMVNVLLLLAGDSNFPEAETYLTDAYNTFLISSTAFGGDDGAFQNGNGYGWYVATLLETLVTIKSVTGIDLSSLPYYAKYPDYLMAFTAPLYKELMVPFGDDHAYTYFYLASSFDTLQPYALFTQNAYHQWYFEANAQNATNQALRPVTYFNLVGMGQRPVTKKTPDKNNWYFPDAGLASLTSDISNANRSSLAFRSSKWGAYNHSYADQNSFTLVSNGKDMLISSGYYFSYGSPHHLQTRASKSHNVLTFDGGIGQSEAASSAVPLKPTNPVDTTDSSGDLINGGEANGIAIVTGDASKAYRRQAPAPINWVPLLNNAIRSIAYFKEEKISVIYDWATSATPRTWELNFHALQAFDLSTPGFAKVVNGNSSICIYHQNFPSSMATTDQFEVPADPPSGTLAPNQYHLRSTANQASTELSTVTIIKENCSATAVNVSINGSDAVVSIGSKGVEFNQKVVNIFKN
ncbi:DUF4962 domain-containing protein [Undibacterium sp. Di27W]